MLDVSRRRIVIVGGGAVAAKRAQSLIAAGAARIRVVATQFHATMPAQVERLSEDYRTEHLAEADIVFAAADDADLNTRVVADAWERAILASWTEEDDDHAGDFVSPAIHREGAVTVAVAAGSAALSAAIRDGIAARFDPRWTRMAEAMQVLRPRIRDDANLSSARRRAIYRDLADEDALAAATVGPEQVWRWLVSKHPDLARH